MSLDALPGYVARRIDRDPAGVPGLLGCWLWTGTLTKGYGHVNWRNKTYGAHRLVYLLLVGDVPKGLFLDHLCRVRACVNPAHLEPVTPAENSRRGRNMGGNRGNARPVDWDAEIRRALSTTPCGQVTEAP